MGGVDGAPRLDWTGFECDAISFIGFAGLGLGRLFCLCSGKENKIRRMPVGGSRRRG